MRPEVSVVMPVRNGAVWVGAAIASIVGQPVDDLELVVVDDGSTDATVKHVERWVKADRRVRLVSGPCAGPGAAFDRGVEHVRADIIARMDADDVALPWRLPRQLAYFRMHSEVVVLGGLIELMDPDGGLLGLERLPLDDEDIRARLPAHCFFNPTLAFRRSALEAIGGHRAVFDTGEDVDLVLRLAVTGAVANLGEPLVRYRLHGGSASDRGVRRQAVAVLVAQESYRRRARGQNDPVDRASTLDEAVQLLGLEEVSVDEAVGRALIGRASVLARAGVRQPTRRLAGFRTSPPGIDARQRARIAQARRIAVAERQRDDYVGARRSCDSGSALVMALGLRRAASRGGTAARRLVACVRRAVGRQPEAGT